MTSWTPQDSPHVNRKMACVVTPPLNYFSAATECLRGKSNLKHYQLSKYFNIECLIISNVTSLGLGTLEKTYFN